MRRALAAALCMLMMFTAALAEVPEDLIEIMSAADNAAAAELPEEASDETSVLPDEDDAPLPEDTDESASGTSPEGQEEIAPTVLSYKKNKTKTVWLGTVYQFKVPGKKIKSYTSSAKKVATVDKSGIITLKKVGNARITAKLKNGQKVVLTLKVADPLVPAGVAIREGGKATLDLGDTLHLTASVSPKTAPQDVTWTSSRERVATVDGDGFVTVWNWGKTTLTAATPNKKSASFTLTVKKPKTGQYMISHAMGGVDGHNYTNCLEGFLENYAEGHRIFEVDLEYTSDGRIVLCHDWNRKLYTGQKVGSKPTFNEFMGAKIYDKYTPLSIDDLLLLMNQYPDVTIITDSKYDDIATVKRQFNTIVDTARALDVEGVLDQFVVEIYNKEMLDVVRDIYPFKNYVFTLYKYFKKAPSKSQLKNVAAFCQNNGVATIAMSTKWWKSSMVKTYISVLKSYDIDIALFSTSSKSDARKYLKDGVTALFTDFLPPLK